ncbi:hypothetical protein BLNAU_3184 [Blattamonas nauphoetae]|uniref:Uncharacterized protein n=1 Tax=Blattamonas nauphoetae TaxID=2049346 RepID=A0ABQ9YDC9_9EUKA|nr:hypothetical protein BLNAU_3184 [Blattamonas nauphoetae]
MADLTRKHENRYDRMWMKRLGLLIRFCWCRKIFNFNQKITDIPQELERQLEERSETFNREESSDPEEFQTCRSILDETHWRDLLCVQLGLTQRQSKPQVDEQSIEGVQDIILTWLNKQLSLSFDLAFNSDPYTSLKNSQRLPNAIVQTLSTVAVSMLRTLVKEACCKRLYAQMRALVGSHRQSINLQKVLA